MKLYFTMIFILISLVLFSITYTVKRDGTGDYTQIQDAIDASSDNDIVLVYPGIYYENLTISGKDITLAPLEYTTNDESYVEQTVIDGNMEDSVIFFGGTPANTSLIDFTIQHGKGHPNSTVGMIGGGFYIKVNSNVLITNNTFSNNADCTCIYVPSGSHANATNNIFAYNGKSYEQNITLSYCNIYGNTNNNHNGFNIITQDPLINSSYTPIWTATEKSPLIDSGDPQIDDPDGTRSDIGAKRAVIHQRYNVELPDNTTNNGIKWTCFPVLDNIYTLDARADSLLYDIMHPTSNPPLEEVQYKIEDNDKQSISYDDEHWTNDDHQFASVLGYKFKMQGNEPYTLDVNGFLAPPSSTIQLYADTQNWIGYFLEDSQTLEDAFGPNVWPHIESVVTQHWFWIKPIPDPNGGGVSDRKDRYTLNYGDMLIVKCDTDITFHWNNGVPVDPKEKAKPEYFVPDEKMDYIPVYVKVASDSSKAEDSELGIFMDGVCVGAAVLSDTLIDIPVYPVESSKGDSDIEFVIYYGGTKNKETIKDYFVYDEKRMQMVKKSLDLITGQDYYYVSLTDENTEPPKPERVTLSNYPNPFNPTTTIKYSLPNDENIQLDVYNIKGQKVKTLVNGNQKAGYYKSVWNGKDDNGKKVSSGVYLYRLKTSQKTMIRKMLMLK